MNLSDLIKPKSRIVNSMQLEPGEWKSIDSDIERIKMTNTDEALTNSKDFSQLFKLLSNLKLSQIMITTIYDMILKEKREVMTNG